MIFGIIPARGSSKGIPRKNLKELCGYLLIWWSIQAAKESKLLDNYIVSTEDEEISTTAKKYGAEVLPRPPHLAADDSILIGVVKHVNEHIKADIFVLLCPTSPIRIGNIVDKAIKRFIDRETDSLATGYMSKYYEWGTIPEIPRQKKKGFFIADGCVYIHKAEVLLNGKWYGDKLEKMAVPHYYNFDIDEEADLWAVEGVFNNLQRKTIYAHLMA